MRPDALMSAAVAPLLMRPGSGPLPVSGVRVPAFHTQPVCWAFRSMPTTTPRSFMAVGGPGPRAVTRTPPAPGAGTGETAAQTPPARPTPRNAGGPPPPPPPRAGVVQGGGGAGAEVGDLHWPRRVCGQGEDGGKDRRCGAHPANRGGHARLP